MPKLLRIFRHTRANPLYIIAALWSLALLTPYLPGLPRPGISGLPYRQELVIGILLCLTCFAVCGQVYKSGAANEFIRSFDFRRREALWIWLPLISFTLWSAASTAWALDVHAARVHTAQWFLYLLFFALMRFAVRHARIWRASVRTLAVVLLILGTGCTLEWLLTTQIDHKLSFTPATTFRGFNGFSEVMIVAAPFFLALALHFRQSKHRRACAFVSLVAWLTTIQAMQRAPLLGLIAAFAVMMLAVCFFPLCRPRGMRRAVMLGVVFIIAAIFQQVVSFRPADPASSAIARLQTFQDGSSANLRHLFWGIGFEEWRARPLTGVGANNYETLLPEGRARFAAKHLDNPLVGKEEESILRHAHNEYVQVLAELGLIGIILLAWLGLGLTVTWRLALREPRGALPALGAGAGLLAFAISSGASGFSFRWTGGGLIFFFVAAVIVETAHRAAAIQHQAASHTATDIPKAFALKPLYVRALVLSLCLTVVAVTYGAAMRGGNVYWHGAAQYASDAKQAEAYFQKALWFNDEDAATHSSYGSWLLYNNRAGEAVPHLRYATRRGMNASVCYADLALAQADSGDMSAASRTLAYAVSTYPRSIFLRSLHQATLAKLGDFDAARREHLAALKIDEAAARGWYKLVNDGIESTQASVNDDARVAKPGDLAPQSAVHQVIGIQRLHQASGYDDTTFLPSSVSPSTATVADSSLP